jgi:hypothetical protein
VARGWALGIAGVHVLSCTEILHSQYVILILQGDRDCELVLIDDVEYVLAVCVEGCKRVSER